MKRPLLLLSVLILSFTLSGCMSAGSFLAHNVTNVELSEPNFRIAAKDMEGHAKASHIFGVSYSMGSLSNTFALARVGGPAKLYNHAIQDLWQNYREQHGEIEGKKLALANVRIDSDMLNLMVYTQSELYITADVVEFVEE
ncbi:MAG: DUF6567 family protein [Bacteroidales bacterium]